MGEWIAFDYSDGDVLTEKKSFTRKEKTMVPAGAVRGSKKAWSPDESKSRSAFDGNGDPSSLEPRGKMENTQTSQVCKFGGEEVR